MHEVEYVDSKMYILRPWRAKWHPGNTLTNADRRRFQKLGNCDIRLVLSLSGVHDDWLWRVPMPASRAIHSIRSQWATIRLELRRLCTMPRTHVRPIPFESRHRNWVSNSFASWFDNCVALDSCTLRQSTLKTEPSNAWLNQGSSVVLHPLSLRSVVKHLIHWCATRYWT